VQDINIIEESPAANKMRISMALIKTVVIQQEQYLLASRDRLASKSAGGQSLQ
jgi:hypothetical protein